jgi:carbamate kinase
VILTDIDYVHSGSGHAIMKRIAAKELRGRMSEFEEGTIRPKLEACVGFVENGGRSAAIGNVFKLDSVIRNRSGTRIF